jgi:hypothetical protein
MSQARSNASLSMAGESVQLMATSWESVKMPTLGKTITHIDMSVVKCENFLDEIGCVLGWVIRKWGQQASE